MDRPHELRRKESPHAAFCHSSRYVPADFSSSRASRGRSAVLVCALTPHQSQRQHQRRGPTMKLQKLEARRLFAVAVTETFPGYYELQGDNAANVISVSVSQN